MDQPGPSRRSDQIAKRSKLNNERDQHATSNETPSVGLEQTADILKLDIDCFEEAFDYLPFIDLVSVGKTCKRLQQVAGYCFQQNYSGSAYCNSNGIIKYVDVRHFVPFTQRIEVDELGLRFLFAYRLKFQRLKQIEFTSLKTADINRLAEFSMGKVEVLRMTDCDLGNNFSEIIVHYAKLRCLKIENCCGEFNWLDRKYPTLEYFKFKPLENKSIEGIPVFLELNPNIRKFATTVGFLLENRDNLMLSNVKLDDLAIFSYCGFNDESVCNLLNALHGREFYKKLQLYFRRIEDQEQINQLVNIQGLVKLYVSVTRETPFEFSSLKNLEELRVELSDDVADLEILPNKLTNLKRIHFKETRIHAIMPLISRSVEMQKIRIDYLFSGTYYNIHTKVIDLVTLNREREKLPDAEKITLYVGESIYLATKWAMKGNDFTLIRLKRSESFEWNHDSY